MTAKRKCVVLSTLVVSVLLLSGMGTVIASVFKTEMAPLQEERASNVISELPEAGEYTPRLQEKNEIDISPIVEPKPLKVLEKRQTPLSPEEREKARQYLASLKQGAQTFSSSNGGIIPNEYDAAVAHNATSAWGITEGDGVNIAVIDSGIDFGHDDLSGDMNTYFESWPRVTDIGSPYYGWPIAYDANAQGLYLKYGIPNALENNDWMSSYANMRYRQIVSKDTAGTPATDYWGNKLAVMFQGTFYIPPGGDVIPPKIAFTYPANGSGNIPPLTTLIIRFTEPMDTASFENSITWTPDYLNGNVTYTWSLNDMLVSIKNASGSWPAGTITYAINQKVVYDTAGNALGKWVDPRRFTVVSPDNIAPSVSINPGNGATVINTTCWNIKFTEQMNKTATESGITADGGTIALKFEWDETETSVTACPASPLSNQAHSLLVDATKVKDLAGNPLSASTSVAITATADNTNPVATLNYPAPGSVDFPYYIQIGFSERMDPASLDLSKMARGIQLFPNDDVDLSKLWEAKWDLAGMVLTLTPKTPYRYNSLYFSDFTVRIDDGSGKYLEYTDGNSIDGYRTLLKYPGGPKINRLYAIDGILSGGAYNNTSAAYRLGVHKDLNFITMFGERPGMLAVANATGVYDTIYVDLNDNQMFNDDTPITKVMSVAKIDYDYDGYIDANSGLLYWISDGKNLPPYAEFMAKHLNLTLPTPPVAGELVLMAGEFILPAYDTGFGHGTEVAVGAAGRGFSDRVISGMFTGIAPKANLIYTGSFAFTQLVDSANSLNNTLGMFYFAVEGYDGVPGTGDEAQVVALTASPPSGLSGLSFYDRFIDYITIDVGKGNTLFVTGAGEGGPGYGTISVFGGASTALTVGDAFHHYYRPLLGSDGGPNPQSGWINTFTASRGPTVSGQPKPDILAGGTYSWIAVPLSEGYETGMGFPGMDLAGDDRVAAGTAAGAAALVYAGWNRSVFGAPSAWQVKGVLMGAAKDLMNNPLTQGAGLLDVGRAVAMANMSGPAGVYAYIPGAYPTSSWVPGEFRGNSSNSFLKFVEPGKSYAQEIKVQNMGDQPVTVDLTAGVYEKKGEWTYTYRSTNGLESFIINQSGYFTTTGVKLKSVDSSLWQSENAIISFIYDRNTAPKIGGRIDAFYWTDVNGNNQYGGGAERNRFAVINAATNIFQFIIPNPSKTIPGGPGPSGKGVVFACMSTNPCPADTLITIKVEFFNKVKGIISLDKDNLTIPSGKIASFNATLNVPWDAGTGSYEFMIFYTANGKQSVIPVLASVMSKGTSGKFSGGPAVNSAMYGAGTVLPNSKMFYYFETPYDVVQRPGMRGIIDIDAMYAGTGGDVSHYIEKAFDPKADKDDAGMKNSAKYGPFKMVETDTGAPGSFTKSGGGISKAFTITPGINLLVVRYSQLAGKDTIEPANGEIGIFEFGPVAQDLTNPQVYVNTNQKSGLTPVYTRSTVEWNGIAGVATATISNTSTNQKILFNDYSVNGTGSFIEYLTKSGTKLYDNITSDVVIVSWHMIGTGNNKDSDLGVFYDENHDYIPQVSEFVKYDADADADEKVELVVPKPGMYIICLAGFDFGGSKEPSTYNWENLKTIISTTATIYPYGMPSGKIKPNEKGEFYVKWTNLVQEGDNKGAFYLGTGDAPLSFMLLVPITIRLDLTPMTIMNPVPADGATVNTNKPAFAIQIGSDDQVVQLDDTRTRLYVDNIEITNEGKVNRDYMAGNPPVYYPGGIVVQLKSFSLADGEHMAKVVAYDWAGNIATFTWRFFVLSSAPGLSILSPAEGKIIVKDTSYTIVGLAPGATEVTIYGSTVITVYPSPSGEFTAAIPLTPNAENLIRIEAVNAVGNKATDTRTIISDMSAPAIVAFSSIKTLTSDPIARVTFKLDVQNEPGTYGAILNGMEVAVLSDGSGVSTVMLQEGENTITLQSFDQVGNTATSTISVIRDSTPPVLVVDEESFPASGYTDKDTITVKGTFKDLLTNVTVTVNGKRVDTSGKEGTFSIEVPLYSWSNTIVVTATDQAGNSVSVVKSVGYVIKGTNYGYILGALAVVLAVLGAIIGFLLGKGLPKEEKKEEEKEEEKKEGEEEAPPPPEEEKKEGEEEVPPPPPEEETPPPTEEPAKESETDVLKPE